MMELLSQYGNLLDKKLKQSNTLRAYLESFTERIKLTDKRGILLLFQFNLNSRELTILKEDISEQNQEDIAENYLWVGNTDSTTNRFITTNYFNRILAGDFKNLKNEEEIKNQNPLFQLNKFLKDNTNIKGLIEDLLETFYPETNHRFLDFNTLRDYYPYIKNLYQMITHYQTLGSKAQKNKKLIEINKFISIFSKKELEALCDGNPTINDLKTKIEKTINELISTYYEKKKNLSKLISFFCDIIGQEKKYVSLVSVSIDGQKLSDNIEYINFLYRHKIPKTNLTVRKNCSICNTLRDDVDIDYLKKSKMKFFNTDKQIFSQGLSDNYNNNFGLCNSCFLKLALGEKYILKYFKKYWGGKNIMIIPEITPMYDLDSNDLDYLTEQVDQISKNLYNFQDVNRIETVIEDFMKSFSGKSLVFHFIFFNFAQGGKPNKIIKIIKDIPPTRISEIIKAFQNIILEDVIKNRFYIDLRKLYYVIPQKVDSKSGEPKGKGIFLDLFEAIFYRFPIPKRDVIEAFSHTIKILFLESPGYNISIKDSQKNLKNKKINRLVEKILEMNSIIKLFELIGCFPLYNPINSVSNKMIENKKNPQIWNEIEKYWAGKNIYQQNQQKSLFLLGILVSQVGSAQYNKLKSEPILKKIKFDGMKRIRLIQLSNKVMDLLNKYKAKNNRPLVQYNYDIIANFHNFFDSVDENDWELTPMENIFYIMSGYAFKKKYNWTFLKTKKNENEEEKEEMKI